jgi:hypothetical protein
MIVAHARMMAASVNNPPPDLPPCSASVNFVRYNPKVNFTVLTCIQVQGIEKANGVSSGNSSTTSSRIMCCLQCGSFELERAIHTRLRGLKDNNPFTGTNVPRQYSCQTLWIPVYGNSETVTPGSFGHETVVSPAVSSSPCKDPPLRRSPNDPPILSAMYSSASPPLQQGCPKRTSGNYSSG